MTSAVASDKESVSMPRTRPRTVASVRSNVRLAASTRVSEPEPPSTRRNVASASSRTSSPAPP